MSATRCDCIRDGRGQVAVYDPDCPASHLHNREKCQT